MITRTLSFQGHLIDSGQLTIILARILEEGADYMITHVDIGKKPDEESLLKILIKADNKEMLESLTPKLVLLGARVEDAPEAQWAEVVRDKAAPDNFYSTTNHQTEVFLNDEWRPVHHQRMDASILLRNGELFCVKLRDLKKGDRVLVGAKSVRVHPPGLDEANPDRFSFMANDVSSERNTTLSALKTAEEMHRIKKSGGKIVVVAGPVVVHTGGSDALASLVRDGWVNGFLGGNAIAVHDIEYRLFNTSLGVDLESGASSHEGHKNHMMAINTVYRAGGIKNMMDEGALNSGLMYEIIRAGIPCCLAGSIRDDGPLPETEMDMIRAQQQYADIVAGADLVLMLSSMLHSIGTGNMIPSWVRTVCVDINPAVVTKLADRGSAQAIGVVSDVGLFLRSLAMELAELEKSKESAN